ncbi:hypothetical protein [Brachyspira hyodysenteriae]|uniref:hypothetical protein n=1 Tax=Brachyspira hyodysenteriae TaxID=159 RepID=UPI00063D9557|nr:hypothetical protein [Brachyspira hyodysenteriae]KLI13787.1 hypothetical protein SU45_12045 [Brachyspira hyodysenteriae]KLI59671.1 hypothetical protein SZ46_08445 [Brachyspira hyodysenteriae]
MSNIITTDYEKIFENKSNSNGFLFWYARDLMITLGYKDYNTFKKPINKAISICASLNIDFSDNFVAIKRMIDGKEVEDFKLSRFACYLIAIERDIKKVKSELKQTHKKMKKIPKSKKK